MSNFKYTNVSNYHLSFILSVKNASILLLKNILNICVHIMNNWWTTDKQCLVKLLSQLERSRTDNRWLLSRFCNWNSSVRTVIIIVPWLFSRPKWWWTVMWWICQWMTHRTCHTTEMWQPGPDCTRPGIISPPIWCVIISHIWLFYKIIIQLSENYIEKLM